LGTEGTLPRIDARSGPGESNQVSSGTCIGTRAGTCPWLAPLPLRRDPVPERQPPRFARARLSVLKTRCLRGSGGPVRKQARGRAENGRLALVLDSKRVDLDS
jgi:hypothetical protein